MVLLGSSPLSARRKCWRAPSRCWAMGRWAYWRRPRPNRRGPPASISPCWRATASRAVDLGVTIDTVDYAAHDAEFLDGIAGMRGILLCGGNQIRLVETLLHRGEESALLRAIARAHAKRRCR